MIDMKNDSFAKVDENGLSAGAGDSRKGETYVLSENVDRSYRRERLLLKCENIIFADEIENLLKDAGISSRLHDEREDPQPGAYGAVTGIAIYVFAEDYDRASALVEPVLNDRRHVHPFCPKCGSEDVSPIKHRRDYGTRIALLSLFLILVAGIYMAPQTSELGIRSAAGDIIAVVAGAVGIILLFAVRSFTVNFKCNKCGKKFNRS